MPERRILLGLALLAQQVSDRVRAHPVATAGQFGREVWDLITFYGFLGTGMCLQFTRLGCDSALAAPLVLDLARITLAAHAAGHTGPLAPFAYFFFKDPLGDVDHALHAQWEALRTYLAGLGAGPGGSR